MEIYSTEGRLKCPFEPLIALVPPQLLGTHEACLADGYGDIHFESGLWDGSPVAVGAYSEKIYENLAERLSEGAKVVTDVEYGDLGILDGHHRTDLAIRKLALRFIPVQVIPLEHSGVVLGTWLENFVPLTVEQVRSYFKRPDEHVQPKTTKFQITGTDGRTRRIRDMQLRIKIPLENLK